MYDRSEAERIQMYHPWQPYNYDTKICIALFSNEPSDAERIRRTSLQLVHQFRERNPVVLTRSNPKGTLARKLLSLSECGTDKGIHNELFLPPQCFGLWARTRGGTLGFFACMHTRIKKICGKSKKCICSGRSILDLTKLGAHGGLG